MLKIIFVRREQNQIQLNPIWFIILPFVPNYIWWHLFQFSAYFTNLFFFKKKYVHMYVCLCGGLEVISGAFLSSCLTYLLRRYLFCHLPFPLFKYLNYTSELSPCNLRLLNLFCFSQQNNSQTGSLISSNIME